MPENVSSPEELYASNSYELPPHADHLFATLFEVAMDIDDIYKYLDIADNKLEVRYYGFSAESDDRLYAAFCNEKPFALFTAFSDHKHTLRYITDKDAFSMIVGCIHAARIKDLEFDREEAISCNADTKLTWFGDYEVGKKQAVPAP